MITTQYQFRYIDSKGMEVLYTCTPNTDNWHDLVRDFELFLKSCSFVFIEGTKFDRIEGDYDWR